MPIGNGRILYDTPNRGNMVTLRAFGQDLLPEGSYTIVSTGWRATVGHISFLGNVGDQSVRPDVQLQFVQAVVEWIDGTLNGNMEALK